MNNQMFLKCLNNSDLQEWGSRVALEGSYRNYFISYYLDESNKFIVEEFGVKSKGKWEANKPTDLQYSMMKKTVEKEANRLYDLRLEE